MQRPPHDPNRAILSRDFVRRIAIFGALITVVTLVAFVWALRGSEPGRERAITVAFMTLALAQIFHLGNARGREPVLSWDRLIANRWALAAVALTLGLQLLAIYFPPLADVLQLVPLAAEDWMVIVPLALIPAILGQGAAWLGARRRRRPEAAT